MARQRSVVVAFAQTVCIDRSHLRHLLGLKGIPDLTALPSTLAFVHNIVSCSKQQLHANQSIFKNDTSEVWCTKKMHG